MPEFDFPPPARQVYVHEVLAGARPTVLHAAVRAAAADIDPRVLRDELARHVPSAGLQALQGTGVRDELVFAVPPILRHTPTTLGYYRLLLGASQKRFYQRGTGLLPFKSMEDRGHVRAEADPLLDPLCDQLNQAMAVLVTALPTGSLREDIDQLPLMMLGAQADGSWRTRIGQEATKGVFAALKNVILQRDRTITTSGDNAVTVMNSAGREVTLALAPDPDVVIKEQVNDQVMVKVALEIKGGTDVSNVHNRAGEAEKSHRKAFQAHAQDFWTVISLTGADREALQRESPTTRQWFDVEEVLAGTGPSWTSLVNHTISAMGI